MGRGEGVSPSPLRKGSGEGALASSPEIFFDFYLKMVFWCILGGASALYLATAYESEAEEEGRERALVKDDILQ